MKYSKKFIEDLHKIGEWAFVEKNMWVGKLVPDIIVDNLQKRGITPDDLEGCVVLSIEEAKILLSIVMDSAHDHGITQEESDVFRKFVKRIKKADMSIASTQCENVSKKDEKIDIKQQDEAND